MLKISISLSFLLLLNFALLAQINVLFIGNSYTYSNQTPQIFSEICSAADYNVSTLQSIPGGSYFEMHCSYQPTLDKINERDWDYVILQEQSQIPSYPADSVAVICYPFATQLCNLIRENNPCTKIMFFMTWGRKNGDSQNCSWNPDVCTFEGMQARLRTSYLEMGNQNNAMVAPCGMSWKKAINSSTNEIELYFADGSHPNINGSYLNACTFFATIFQQSPLGIDYFPPEIDEETALFLQEMAATTVLDSLDTWRANCYKTEPAFSFETSGRDVEFTNNSINSNSFYWDFGDGNLSIDENPTHTYEFDGTYYVSLEASQDGCFANQIIDIVNVSTADIISLQKQNFTFELSNDFTQLSFSSNYTVLEMSLFSINGKELKKYYKPNFEIALPKLSSGIFLLKVKSENGVFCEKFFVR